MTELSELAGLLASMANVLLAHHTTWNILSAVPLPTSSALEMTY